MRKSKPVFLPLNFRFETSLYLVLTLVFRFRKSLLFIYPKGRPAFQDKTVETNQRSKFISCFQHPMPVFQPGASYLESHHLALSPHIEAFFIATTPFSNPKKPAWHGLTRRFHVARICSSDRTKEPRKHGTETGRPTTR